MSSALIDDQLVGAVLRGRIPRYLADKELCATGHWYVRLCQAVLGADERTGVLSRPFAGLPPALRERAVSAVLELPEEIGVVSLRELGPTIARLRRRHPLNILGAEALAVAVRLEARVYLSAPSPLLESALRSEGRAVKVVRVG